MDTAMRTPAKPIVVLPGALGNGVKPYRGRIAAGLGIHDSVLSKTPTFRRRISGR